MSYFEEQENIILLNRWRDTKDKEALNQLMCNIYYIIDRVVVSNRVYTYNIYVDIDDAKQIAAEAAFSALDRWNESKGSLFNFLTTVIVKSAQYEVYKIYNKLGGNRIVSIEEAYSIGVEDEIEIAVNRSEELDALFFESPYKEVWAKIIEFYETDPIHMTATHIKGWLTQQLPHIHNIYTIYNDIMRTLDYYYGGSK